MGDHLAHIKTVDVDDGLFAPRPDYGDQGNAVQMWANYFEMHLTKKDLDLHRYEMSFEVFPPKDPPKKSPPPEKELTIPAGKKLVPVIRCALTQHNFENLREQIATDFSKSLISCKRLDTLPMRTNVFPFRAENELENGALPKNAIQFRMTLEHKGELCISDLLNYLASGIKNKTTYENALPIIQGLDIILGHHGKFSLEVATPKQGKCFPYLPTDAEKFKLRSPKNTPGYLQGVRGFFASVRATTDRTLVNCNACCGAFYKPGPLVDLFNMFLPSQNPSLEQYKRLESAIQGLRVQLTHLNLKDNQGRPIQSFRTVFGLARPYRGPQNATFEYEKEDITVAAYWAKKGYTPITNFALPLLNVGDKNHPSLVPPHVCEIVPGQMAKKKLDSLQTTDMIDYARRKPEDTRKSINAKAFDVLGLTGNRILESFGISIDSDMVVVQGRLLAKPTIIYQEGAVSPPVNEKGRWNLRDHQVFQAKPLVDWGILWIRDVKGAQRDEQKLNQNCSFFINTLKKTLGKQIPDNPTRLGRLGGHKEDDDVLRQQFERCRRQNISFLVIVLPDNDPNTYKQIKKLGDIEYGIHTVCVLGEEKKFYSGSTQYFANVALKINLKLGGVNHRLQNQDSLYKTTMVIGIDVTHPSPGPTKKTAPSVAAMVASIDDELSQWPVDLRINTAGKEMVDLLGPMLTTRLELWKSKHGKALPENILIYRDGVSESQYEAVLREELEQLRNTCGVFYSGRKNPKITLIIVGKRHHTRFFKQLGSNNSTNPDYGTVVDTGVTEARNWDFFLQSHHALIGTARPAHYFVLLNEIFTKESLGQDTNISDYLQKLTYEMCYLSGRSTGPVSIPPPVYYADLACERSRCYGDFDDDISDTSSMIDYDSGNAGSSGGTKLPYRSFGSGSQTADRPGPSNQRSSAPAPVRNEDVSKMTIDSMKQMSKKEKARFWEQRSAAATQKAAGESSKAEEKKAEGKNAEAAVESKAKEKMAETNAGWKPKEEKLTGDAPSKAQRKKPEAKVEGQKPVSKPGEKTEKEKPKADAQSKMIGKKPEERSEGKNPEAQSEGKKAESKAGGKPDEKKPKEDSQSKAQGEKPETKAEGKKPEKMAEMGQPKEKAMVEIHPNLINTMFYI